MIEKGEMDGDDNKLTLTKYENGRSVYKLADNGDEYWIYPNGNRKAYASADRSYIVMYDEQERWIGCRSKEGYNCVYRYPNSSVKAKGKEDAMGNRIGNGISIPRPAASPSRKTALSASRPKRRKRATKVICRSWSMPNADRNTSYGQYRRNLRTAAVF